MQIEKSDMTIRLGLYRKVVGSFSRESRALWQE